MIFYSHVNEDSFPEQSIIEASAYARLIVVAGSGERVLSLMANPHLKKIQIVDSNSEALFLTELKIKALELLTVSQYLFFIGFNSNSEANLSRKKLFLKIREQLSHGCAEYWRQYEEIIYDGRLLLSGHFERFLSRVNSLMQILFYSRIDRMMGNPLHSWYWYERTMWGVLKNIFSSKIPYMLFGNKDPAFVKGEANLGTIGSSMHELWVNNLQKESIFIHLLFKGGLKEMLDKFAPSSLQNKHLEEVQMRLQNRDLTIEYINSDLLTFLQSENKFCKTFVSTSDLLSFCSPEYMDKVLDHLTKYSDDGLNTVVWRAFLKYREYYPEKSVQGKLNISEKSHLEKTKMYKVFQMNF